MNFLLVVPVCAILLSSFASCLTKDEIKLLQDTMLEVGKVCIVKENVNAADWELLQKHVFPSSREGVCFFRCFLEELGLTKNGVFSTENFVKQTKTLISGDDPATLKMIADGGDQCVKEVSGETDPCEFAKKLTECGQRTYAKWGVDLTP